jgi:hypothetical protein
MTTCRGSLDTRRTVGSMVTLRGTAPIRTRGRRRAGGYAVSLAQTRVVSYAALVSCKTSPVSGSIFSTPLKSNALVPGRAQVADVPTLLGDVVGVDGVPSAIDET